MENLLVLIIYLVVSLVLSLIFFILHKIFSNINHIKDKIGIDKELLKTFQIAFLTFLWYAISVSFTLFNKWFLSEWHGGFQYPIITSTFHLTMKFTLTRIWVWYHKLQFESISIGIIVKIVIPIGIATAMDIMLSNLSLVHISVTLYTVIKASVVVWVFFWGVLFRLEKFRVVTFFAVLITSGGLGLAVSSHTSVNVVGLLLCLGAAAAGGLRWALTQQLMISDEYSKNIFIAIYRFSPASALSMLPFALGVELQPFLKSTFVQNPELLLQATIMTVMGGFIAFALILTEVDLVRLSSSLTMGMLGQLKEVLQIALALAIFRDELHPVNAIGIVISLAASAFYRYIKSSEAKELALQTSAAYMPLAQFEGELDVFNDVTLSNNSGDDDLSENNDNNNNNDPPPTQLSPTFNNNNNNNNGASMNNSVRLPLQFQRDHRILITSTPKSAAVASKSTLAMAKWSHSS